MTTVRTEVEAKVAAFATARGIPVAYENVSFEKPESGSWLEVYFLAEYAKPRGVDASGVTRHGMFQVSVYSPIGTGMAEVEALAEDIAALFPVVPKMAVTSIESPPGFGSSSVVDNFVHVPITVRYRAEY